MLDIFCIALIMEQQTQNLRSGSLQLWERCHGFAGFAGCARTRGR